MQYTCINKDFSIIDYNLFFYLLNGNEEFV